MALIVTAGFEDVLELARLKVPDPYNIFSHRPTPLVPRERVYGITERMLKDGSIDTPLDRASVEQAVRAAQRDGVDTIVVALLHSCEARRQQSYLRHHVGLLSLPAPR